MHDRALSLGFFDALSGFGEVGHGRILAHMRGPSSTVVSAAWFHFFLGRGRMGSIPVAPVRRKGE